METEALVVEFSKLYRQEPPWRTSGPLTNTSRFEWIRSAARFQLDVANEAI